MTYLPRKLATLSATQGSENLTATITTLIGRNYNGKTGQLDLERFSDGVNGPQGLDILPPNMIWSTRSNSSMIVEIPAQVRTIRLRASAGDSGVDASASDFTLWFPKLYMNLIKGAYDKYTVVRVDHEAPLNDQLDYVNKTYAPFPFPNIFSSGRVCPWVAPDYDATNMSTAAKVSLAIYDYWGSVFNFDIGDFTAHPLHQKLSNPTEICPGNRQFHDLFEGQQAIVGTYSTATRTYGRDLAQQATSPNGINHQTLAYMFNSVIDDFFCGHHYDMYDDSLLENTRGLSNLNWGRYLVSLLMWEMLTIANVEILERLFNTDGPINDWASFKRLCRGESNDPQDRSISMLSTLERCTVGAPVRI